MERSKLSTLIMLGACAVAAAQTASAQNCTSSVAGYYTYSTLGNGMAGSLLTPTGNTTTTGSTGGSSTSKPTFTNTEVGNLLSGLSGTTPFSTSGSLYFDSGIITASSSTDHTASQQVGTYTLNSDCTISVSLNDAFMATSTTGSTTSSSTRMNPTMLQGIVLRDGAEIDLGMLLNTPTSTTTTTSTGTTTTTSTWPTNGLLQSSTLLVLTRSLSVSCSASNLVGRYGFVAMGTGVVNSNTSATGTTTTSTSQVAPFFLFGLLEFDGNGNIIAPSNSMSSASSTSSSTTSSSPLGYLQFTGSYKVNPDCTGTMTIAGIPTTASTTTTTPGTGTGTGTGTTTTTTGMNQTTSVTLNFVLSQPTAEVNASGQAISAGQAKPRIEFSGATGSQTLVGYATEQ